MLYTEEVRALQARMKYQSYSPVTLSITLSLSVWMPMEILQLEKVNGMKKIFSAEKTNMQNVQLILKQQVAF